MTPNQIRATAVNVLGQGSNTIGTAVVNQSTSGNQIPLRVRLDNTKGIDMRYYVFGATGISPEQIKPNSNLSFLTAAEVSTDFVPSPIAHTFYRNKFDANGAFMFSSLRIESTAGRDSKLTIAQVNLNYTGPLPIDVSDTSTFLSVNNDGLVAMPTRDRIIYNLNGKIEILNYRSGLFIGIPAGECLKLEFGIVAEDIAQIVG